jgi:hypothetical protein
MIEVLMPFLLMK